MDSSAQMEPIKWSMKPRKRTAEKLYFGIESEKIENLKTKLLKTSKEILKN